MRTPSTWQLYTSLFIHVYDVSMRSLPEKKVCLNNSANEQTKRAKVTMMYTTMTSVVHTHKNRAGSTNEEMNEHL